MKSSRHISGSEGLVFDIQKFNIHDGPGIRTLVFLKGCPLSCRWCSNPESWSPDPEIMFYPERCIVCRGCVKSCQSGAVTNSGGNIAFDRRRCEGCGKCAEQCPTQARRLVGRMMTVDEVVQEVEKDRVFYDLSGGGVTITGGEPTMQPVFLKSLLRACKKRGIQVALETNGYVDWRILVDFLEFVDVFLVDIKHMDSYEHRKLTGASNELILKNVINISRGGKGLIIRFPLIPGYTDSQSNLDRLREFLETLSGVQQLDVLPYHSLGEGKYSAVDMSYPLSGLKAPDENTLEQCKLLLKTKKIPVTIGAIG